MSFRPLGNRLIVRRVAAVTESKGGILIPSLAAEKPQEAIVVSVGPGTRLEDGTFATIDVVAGDKILFNKLAGTEVVINDEKLLILKEADVLGVLE